MITTVNMVARRTEVDNLRAQCSPAGRRLTRTYSALGSGSGVVEVLCDGHGRDLA